MKTAHSPAHLLRVYIPEADITPETLLHWALYDAKSQLQHTSSDVVANLPSAKRLELILSPASVRLLTLSVPASTRAQTQKLLPFALEDKLITSVEASHTVLGQWASSVDSNSKQKQVGIASVDKAWLQTLLAQFTQAGLLPHAAYSELQCLPTLQDNEAHIYWQPSQTWWLQNQQAEYLWQATPNAVLIPPATAETIYLWHPVDCIVPEVSSDAVIHRRSWQWFEAAPQPLAINLLEGLNDTHTNQQSIMRPWRLSMILAILLLCVLATQWGIAFWQKQAQSNHLQKQITTLFNSKMPTGTPLVDPVAQMQQYATGGNGKQDTGLSLLAKFAPVLSSYQPLNSLNYSNQQWQVGITVPDAAAADALKQQITEQGLQVSITQSNPNSAATPVSNTEAPSAEAAAAAIGMTANPTPSSPPIAQGLQVILAIGPQAPAQGNAQ